MYRLANQNAQPNYALVFGVGVGIFFVGAYMVNEQKRKVARGEVTRRPRPPALAYNVMATELGPGMVLDFRIGQQAQVTAMANPGAGLSWAYVIEETGPEGSPVAVKQTTGSTEQPGAPVPQTFIFTGARVGTATILLTSTNPQNQVVDSVRFHIDITE